jgi:hypothetical protein
MSAAGGNILTADISNIDLSGSHLSAGSAYFTELCLLDGPVFYFLSYNDFTFNPWGRVAIDLVLLSWRGEIINLVALNVLVFKVGGDLWFFIFTRAE